ncbi:MAG: YggS family pyridoxal phosphate-dependent enzyme [Firmicutes bacterium]|nr:YggS family pyridoxal phosphate-dependent enzyme [Bacillota bacterium]
MQKNNDIIKNAQGIKNNIQELCAKIGRNPNDIIILAATKTVSADKINELSSVDIYNAGENRVQELLAKYDAVSSIIWHFVGTLQTNKVKYIIDKVALIHSVDRENLAIELNRQCQKINKIMPILLQINAGEEESKSGIRVRELEALYNFIKLNCPFLEIQGFMPVLPYKADENLYKQMQQIFNRYISKDKNIKFLSMGMSDDYLIAIKYGATIVRLGSCLFGERSY